VTVIVDGVSRPLHSCVVEFESSGSWPERSNVEAVEAMKTALLLQMQRELRDDLGLDAKVGPCVLDVLYPDQIFRVRVCHPEPQVRLQSAHSDQAAKRQFTGDVFAQDCVCFRLPTQGSPPLMGFCSTFRSRLRVPLRSGGHSPHSDH
jgi:hypothetical protein